MNQFLKQEEWVDEVMDSLDGMSKAAVPPFFYTRVQAKLTNTFSVWGEAVAWMSKPVFAVAVLTMVIVLNAMVAFRNIPARNAQLKEAEQVFASEINPSSFSTLETNTEK